MIGDNLDAETCDHDRVDADITVSLHQMPAVVNIKALRRRLLLSCREVMLKRGKHSADQAERDKAEGSQVEDIGCFLRSYIGLMKVKNPLNNQMAKLVTEQRSEQDCDQGNLGGIGVATFVRSSYRLRIKSIFAFLMLCDNASFIGLRCDSLLVVIHGSSEMLHCAVIADPKTGANILQHCNVVTDHKHASLEVLQRR